MADKTDIWMPLYIGDYLAATTHLSAEEHGGYLLLMFHEWKNGSLPTDSESLRRIARIEKDAWSNAWAVLEKFFDRSSGAPVQMNLEKIRATWDAKKVAATEKATAAANKRWKDAPSIPSSNAQAMPQSCPSSSPSSTKAKQVPSRDKRGSDSRHVPFKLAIETYWTFANKGTHLPFTWGPAEAKQLSNLLSATPDLTLLQFQALLNNRARSPGTAHGTPPHKWLSGVLQYSQPLNQFNRTTETGNGIFKGKSESTIDALRRSLEKDGYQAGFGEVGDPETGEDCGSGVRDIHGRLNFVRDEGHRIGDGVTILTPTR